MALDWSLPVFNVAPDMDGLAVTGVVRYPYSESVVHISQPYWTLSGEKLFETVVKTRRMCPHLPVPEHATNGVYSKFPTCGNVVRDGKEQKLYWFPLEHAWCKAFVYQQDDIAGAKQLITNEFRRMPFKYRPEPDTVHLCKTRHDAILKSLGRPFDSHEVKINEIIYHVCNNQTDDLAYCIDFLERT